MIFANPSVKVMVKLSQYDFLRIIEGGLFNCIDTFHQPGFLIPVNLILMNKVVILSEESTISKAVSDVDIQISNHMLFILCLVKLI